MPCRICKNEDLKEVLSLGTTPLANSFLKKEELDKEEERFPLKLVFCPTCKLVQLGDIVPPEKMFKEYVYVSSTTQTFRDHFKKLADLITDTLKLENTSLAVDIGSNDGLLLKGFMDRGVQVMGVEPAENIAEIARKDGVDTVNDFFNKKSVEEIIEKKGKADVVTANNVFAHIDDIHSVIENVKLLLKEDGVFIIEVQYLIDMLEKMTFDNVYHEHLSYFSLIALENLFAKHDMEVWNAQRIDSHGGSLRVFIKKVGNPLKREEQANEIVRYEKSLNIKNLEAYEEFAKKVYDSKETLVKYIKDIITQGKTIAAYGAPAKGNTLLNFCEIGNEYISYVVDDNPLKVDLFTPGTHIPVVNSKQLDEKTPDYILILAWNFAEEILRKTKQYADKGVKFIIPLPSPRIV